MADGGPPPGRLLAQQLLAAGEHVVDVPPTLSARVRLLGSTKASKNDPNDALATASAGQRHAGLRQVVADDHTTVLRSLVDRYRDLVSLRTRTACRLHAWLDEEAVMSEGASAAPGSCSSCSRPSCSAA